MKRRAQEDAALKKLEFHRRDHAARLNALEASQAAYVHQAGLIEANRAEVDEAIAVVREALSGGVDWDTLTAILAQEHRRGNPVARRIAGLKLQQNLITLQLSPADSVDVDIRLTANANARRYYELKRAAAQKHQRTIEASDRAIKSSERKIQQELRALAAASLPANPITRMRTASWFESFLWFVSTENYLVLAGRDPQQNEHLVRKVLQPSDIVLSTDFGRAAGQVAVVVKNANPGRQLPPSTLAQAGAFAVCLSDAWGAKVVTSAWWARYGQVTWGAFGMTLMRGDKQFLPPSPLVMGFAWMFGVDEASWLKNHVDERKLKMYLEPQIEEASQEACIAVESLCLTTKNHVPDTKEPVATLDRLDEAEPYPDTQVKLHLPSSARHGAQDKKPKQKGPAESNERSTVQKASVPKKPPSKAKLRKIQRKYGDQDEEEREIKMQLLAVISTCIARCYCN